MYIHLGPYKYRYFFCYLSWTINNDIPREINIPSGYILFFNATPQ